MVIMTEDGHIKITADAPMITCAKCGKQFVSRGLRDEQAINGEGIAYCDDCEKKMNAILIGGPLDGQKAYDDT